MTTIAYILADPSHRTPEEEAGHAFLTSRYGRSRTHDLSIRDLVAPLHTNTPRLIWWHYDASTKLPPDALAPDVLATLRRHVERGGSLLLTLIAAQYVVDLGVESIRPNIIMKGPWQDECWIKDHPDIRGFASRGGHPVFDGLHGAVYVAAPVKGTPYAAAYYQSPVSPQEGRIVAVEREYIRLNDSRMLVMEYRVGKGRILTIGSHTQFAMASHRFLRHLEKFTDNCIIYLTRPGRARTRATYWTTGQMSVEEVRHRSDPLTVRRSQWTPTYSSAGTLRYPATGNAYDVGGRRILIMGGERRGISEVWVHPMRLLSDVAVAFQAGGSVRTETPEGEVTIRPESITRNYRVPEAVIEETVFGDPTLPVGALHFTIKSSRPVALSLTARVDLREMWPLPHRATGTLRYGWDSGLQALVVSNGSGGGTCVIGAGVEPVTHHVVPHEGEPNELILQFDYRIEGTGATLTIAFAGSHGGTNEAVSAYRTMLKDPARRLNIAAQRVHALLDNTTLIEGPDEDFNEGYRQAIIATERFMATTPGIGTSLMAGFATTAHGWNGGQTVSGRPGYAWYFGRDSLWTSLALLDCGMFDAVRDVLIFLGDQQDLNGKILHEMTTSGYVHYDAADSTPLYLIVMGRYLRATGDHRFVRTQFNRLRAALAFCLSTDSDGDHLMENTNVGHGWVEGGPLFPVHTELYLACCWAEALDQTAYIARMLHNSRLARQCATRAHAVRRTIEREFWCAENHTYSFGKFPDGSFQTERTVFPAIAMYFGIAETRHAQEALDALASESFTADWGTRIVGKESPFYDPASYNSGSVWPLFTGWLSLAEFRYDRPAQGFVHAMTNLLLAKHWSAGFVPEVLHGQRMELAGVCAHQAWSGSMVLQSLIEGMLGYHADAGQRRATMRPYFPPDWQRAEVRNLRVGSHVFSLTMRRRMNTTSFIFSTPNRTPIHIDFQPWLPCGTTIHAIRIGHSVTLHTIHVGSPDDVPRLPIVLKGEIRVTFEHTGGVAPVPPVPRPLPGDDSTCLRLIREEWRNGVYEIVVEGKGDRHYRLELITEGRSQTTEKAWTISVEEGRLALALQFDDHGITTRYQRKTLRVPMEF